MKVMTDIDIDVADRDAVLSGLPCIAAAISRNDNLVKHNTGVYFQEIPYDCRTGMTTLNHTEAGDLGYFKIDFLNNSVYENVRDEEHLNKLLGMQYRWDLLEHKDIVEQLFHINSYFELLKKYKPKSIEDLAMILAIIRPAKAYLQNKSWNVIRDNVWKKESGSEYVFKRSHAIAYSITIVVQLNLIIEESMSSF